jgi:hypothetical protein
MNASEPVFEIDSSPGSVQRIMPPSPTERFEGIDFSASGDTLAIATSETNSVLLFRRNADGRFADRPYQTIGRAPSTLDYPHDVSFSKRTRRDLLAVAQRTGAIAIYSRTCSDGDYATTPVAEIRGPKSGLAFSDGVSFVPPDETREGS